MPLCPAVGQLDGPESGVAVDRGSSSLVLSAYAPATKDCRYIVEMKAGPSSAVWGLTLNVGTYYALDAGMAASDCTASTTPSGTLTGPQTSGFPAHDREKCARSISGHPVVAVMEP